MRKSETRYKQVLAFRSDLDMSVGKIASQAGHAAVSAACQSRIHNRDWFEAWMEEGQCKIAVKVINKDELLRLKVQARDLKLPSALVSDLGLTEIPRGTITCLGIGPAPVERMDRITGKLQLL